MNNKFIDTKQLSLRWHVKEGTIRQWHHEGMGVEPYKINGRLLYHIEDVEQFEKLSRLNKRKKDID